MKRKILLVIVVIILLAGVGVLVLYSQSNGSKNQSRIQVPTALITSLAYAHWSSIGEKNLSSIMAQYSTHYEAVWWFANASSIGPENGRYDCNIPRGPNNCSQFPESAWNTFFNDTPSLSYTVCNFTLTPELDGRASVSATVYYNMISRNETIKVPFVMDFFYYNGTWAVMRDWFGVANNEATLLNGTIASCS